MQSASLPANELERLEALRSYHVLDTEPEADFDALTEAVASVFQTPIALVSLVDESRQWFKSRYGLEASETPREVAFCAHAIHSDAPFVVENALLDERFADNPLVAEPPGIRFYAGVPLVDQEGFRLGTLCAIDSMPKQPDGKQLGILYRLARQVVRLLELRRVGARLADTLERTRLLERLIPICAHCKRVREDRDFWTDVEDYLGSRTGVSFQHETCPTCAEGAAHG